MSPRDELTNKLLRVAKQDFAAFDAVYELTSAKLFGIILRILHRRELAEEVLQEVYLKIWERAGDFDPSRASPITWMAVLARNRALDCARNNASAPIDYVEDVDIHSDCRQLDSNLSELSDDVQRLFDCLNGLAPEKRDMVLLAYHEGYTREDLAKKFNSPVNTIKTWLHRSLAQLRECLGS